MLDAAQLAAQPAARSAAAPHAAEVTHAVASQLVEAPHVAASQRVEPHGGGHR